MANTANWKLLPTISNVRGHKSAQLVCEKKGTCAPQIVKMHMDPTRAPFGAGNFNKEDTIRVNLDLECTHTYMEVLGRVDAWVIDTLAANPDLYFKKHLTRDEVIKAYKPSCTPHEKNGVDYAPSMRCKTNLEGPSKVRCWTPDRIQRAVPEDWRRCTITPLVTFKSIWFMNGLC